MPDALDAFTYGSGVGGSLFGGLTPNCQTGLHRYGGTDEGIRRCTSCRVLLCTAIEPYGDAACMMRKGHLGQHHNPYTGSVW